MEGTLPTRKMPVASLWLLTLLTTGTLARPKLKDVDGTLNQLDYDQQSYDDIQQLYGQLAEGQEYENSKLQNQEEYEHLDQGQLQNPEYEIDQGQESDGQETQGQLQNPEYEEVDQDQESDGEIQSQETQGQLQNPEYEVDQGQEFDGQIHSQKEFEYLGQGQESEGQFQNQEFQEVDRSQEHEGLLHNQEEFKELVQKSDGQGQNQEFQHHGQVQESDERQLDQSQESEDQLHSEQKFIEKLQNQHQLQQAEDNPDDLQVQMQQEVHEPVIQKTKFSELHAEDNFLTTQHPGFFRRVGNKIKNAYNTARDKVSETYEKMKDRVG